MTRQLRFLRALGLAAALLSVAGAERAAADYLLTATGNYESSDGYSDWFDGTTNVDPHLPSLYDTARLEGGSFVATYRFSTTAPPASGDFATHNFNSLAGLTYSLLDPDGAVVHVGSNPTAAFAFVYNDYAGLGDLVADLVLLFAFVNDVSGLVTPPALYQPAPDLYALQSHFRFEGDVTTGSDFIPSLALPTDAAAYLGFSTKTFSAGMTFNDGDVFGFVGGPYQYVESYVNYAITNVTVTAVPEPSSLAICGIGLCFAAAAGCRKACRARR